MSALAMMSRHGLREMISTTHSAADCERMQEWVLPPKAAALGLPLTIADAISIVSYRLRAGSGQVKAFNNVMYHLPF